MIKKRVKPKGLGDSLANLTYLTGITTVMKRMGIKDCGCEKRQEILNKLVKYK